MKAVEKRIPLAHPRWCRASSSETKGWSRFNSASSSLSSDRSSRSGTAGYILNTLLGGGMSSRLFQNIRERQGLAYSIYSDLIPIATLEP